MRGVAGRESGRRRSARSPPARARPCCPYQQLPGNGTQRSQPRIWPTATSSPAGSGHTPACRTRLLPRRREGGQHKPAILADAFEALLGALYLDRGFEAARRFCGSVLEACVEWEELEGVRDYKALLWWASGGRWAERTGCGWERVCACCWW